MWSLHSKKVTNHGPFDCRSIYKADSWAQGRALKYGRSYWVFMTGRGYENGFEIMKGMSLRLCFNISWWFNIFSNYTVGKQLIHI